GAACSLAAGGAVRAPAAGDPRLPGARRRGAADCPAGGDARPLRAPGALSILRGMRASAALLTLLAACVPPAHAQAPPRLEPGVTQELARWRTTHYRDARYALRLRIDARKA